MSVPMECQDRRFLGWVLTGLYVTVAFVGGPWGDLVPPAYGILVVAGCVAGIVYIHFIRPHRIFFGSNNEAVSLKDRRYVAAGLILITAAIIGGFGIFVRMEFPREMTVIERLNEYYSECYNLSRRGQSVEDGDYDLYKNEVYEWISATAHFIRKEMSELALKRFNRPTNPMEAVIRPSKKAAELAEAVRVRCVNLEALIENDEWR